LHPDEPYDRNGEDDEEDDEGWDYLGDGYYTLDERAELREIVRREKQEMRDDADSSKLGILPENAEDLEILGSDLSLSN
jgi:hypothetical protein